MRRTPTWAIGVPLFAVVLSLGFSAQAAAPSDTLLPGSTRGYVSVPSLQNLTDQWNKTQLGELMKDPEMKPFVEDLRRQLQERWSASRERLGLTIDDLRGVPGGEVAAAVIQPGPDQEALAVLVDVTGHQDQANALLQKITASLAKQGAKQSRQEVAGTPVTVFTLPPRERQEAQPTAGKAAAKAAAKPQTPPAPQAIFFLRDNLFCGTDNLGVTKGILTRMSGSTGGSLAQEKPYQEVVKRLKADLGDSVPQLRWYVQPIGYLEAVRAARDPSQRRSGRTLLDVFKSEGFDAIQAIGGTVDFSVDRYQILYRTAVWAPPPYRGSMQMLKFPNGGDFAPQPWVPNQVANYCTFYIDVLNAFDHFGSLFDALYGDGKKGMWKEILFGIEHDTNGAQINLRKEVVAQLNNRVTMISDYQLPITTTSERLLFAIEAKDEKALASGIAKAFRSDKEMRRREFQGHEIWEALPEEKSPVPVVELQLPGFGPEPTGESAPRPPQGHQSALLPNQAITVAHGHLFVASHYDFLEKVLKQAQQKEERNPLAKSVEYQVVVKALEKLGLGQRAAENFVKTDEQYRPTYELIRQGKMPESETMLARVVNTLFGAGKKGQIRKQEIEGSKMPDYNLVRRQLGPAGLKVASEEQGWFLKGCLLPKGK